jgi:hypothetical protein
LHLSNNDIVFFYNIMPAEGIYVDNKTFYNNIM